MGFFVVAVAFFSQGDKLSWCQKLTASVFLQLHTQPRKQLLPPRTQHSWSRYNRAKLHCSDFKFCTEKTGCTSTSHKLVILKSTDVCPLLGCYKAWLISPQLCHLPAFSLHHSAISEWVSKKGSSTSTIFAADCFDTAPQEPRYPESAWKPIFSSV